jgi:hypothetical protein
MCDLTVRQSELVPIQRAIIFAGCEQAVIDFAIAKQIKALDRR